MTQFLYRVQPVRDGFMSLPTAQEDSVVDAHFHHLEKLTRLGVVLLAGRTLVEDASTFGIVVLEAPSEAEARTIMQSDPAVAAGVFAAQLFPYRIALASPRILELVLRPAAVRPQEDGASSI
jgi:uncharacterized protein YciI